MISLRMKFTPTRCLRFTERRVRELMHILKCCGREGRGGFSTGGVMYTMCVYAVLQGARGERK